MILEVWKFYQKTIKKIYFSKVSKIFENDQNLTEKKNEIKDFFEPDSLLLFSFL